VADAIMDLAEGAMDSPWIFAALFAFAAIDAFFPAVPSESLVVTAGVFAMTGDGSLSLTIAAAALGAFAGDHVSYFLGRRGGDHLTGPAGKRTRRSAAFGWARMVLAERGGTIIVVSRYIPGARTAVTVSAGAVRYPLRLFSPFDAIAALSWATYSALVGYVAGAAFEDQPLLAVLVGLGLAVGVAGLVELVRHARRRSTDAAPVA
jgi:membrane-associated protein